MKAAPCSWRVVTWRICSLRLSASRTSIVSSPGTEKTHSQPSASRHSTRRSAAVRGRALERASAGPGEHHDPDLGHVVDGPAKALAPEAAVLDAAVRHVVDPVGRHVVHDHAPDFQLLEGPPGMCQVVGEDTGLQTEERVVDAADGVVEV